jgi:hypothetical protein
MAYTGMNTSLNAPVSFQSISSVPGVYRAHHIFWWVDVLMPRRASSLLPRADYFNAYRNQTVYDVHFDFLS